MNGRVADTILYFADEIFKSDTFHLPINSKQFAHYVNISPENVSRIMKAFSNEKILTFKNRNISIQDKERLIQISKIG
jgi:CRP-like cAMP-binding protein